MTLFEACCIIGLLLIVSHLWFYLRVLRPLHRLVVQSEGLVAGNFAAFQSNCGGISEIDSLRRAMNGMVSHVRRAQQQSRAYTDSLTDGQEAERARIARELHDETSQSLIAILQSIDLARGWVSNDPQRADEMLILARQQAVDSVEGLRTLIGDLRPPALDELGLVPALKMWIDKQRGAQIDIKVMGTERRLNATCELPMFRIVQEAVNNAIRHSQARHITVRVHYQAKGVRVEVQDDGDGFSVPTDLSELATGKHYGLIGIQERVNHLHGQLSIASKMGQGTTISAYIPDTQVIQPAHAVRDPVCSAVIQPEQAYTSLTYNGQRYYFCCPVCTGAFQRDPALYLNTETNITPQL